MSADSRRVTCAATIEGHKFSTGVVMWRRRCKNPVREQGDYCHVHRLRDRRLYAR